MKMRVSSNVRRAIMVVAGLVLLVFAFSYYIFPDVICRSAIENARHAEKSPDRTNVDPIVETCKGAATIVPTR